MDQQQALMGTYVDRILDNLSAHPDREALVDGAQRVSYRQALPCPAHGGGLARARGG